MYKAQFAARGGMLTAASLALLFLASALPTGQVGMCAAAGVLLAAPLAHGQVKLGVLVYLATLILGWIMAPLKSEMLFYTVFGLYSIVKYMAEQPRHMVIEWIIKFIFCNASIALTFMVLKMGFIGGTVNLNKGMLFVIIAFNIVFVIYDIAFSKTIGLLKRIFPKDK